LNLLSEDKDYDLMDPIDCDVMTIAAINLNEMEHFLGKKIAKFSELDKAISYEDNTRNKIRLMASIPSTFGVKNLILGAWGCGVYKNDPEIKWKNKLHEILDGYKTYSNLPEMEEYALYHPKTIEKQEQQNSFYSKL
jgi:uncharacterized protein (TIGR02452 family)